MFKKRFVPFLLFFIVVSFSACEQEDASSIPDYPVYIERNTSLDALQLRTMGGYITVTSANKKTNEYVGYGGVCVFYGYDGNYYAFDMACPKECKRTIRVRLDSIPGYAVCDSCGSVFSIAYGTGSRTSGPASEGLKKYKVSTAGSWVYVSK